MSEEKAGYDRNKDVTIQKEVIKSEKRYLNVILYSYDGGPKRARISPVSKNTNPQADKNKQWINQASISAMTEEEVVGLIKALKSILTKF